MHQQLCRTAYAFFRIALILVAGCLSACATTSSAVQGRGGDYFPGGSRYYSYGVSQSKEGFVNIARAQSDYSMYPGSRHWVDITVRRSPSEFNVLQAYFPLHVRWVLKDGRQFIAENIDVRAIMGEYFKSHEIDLPFQKEARPFAPGDYDPSFVHEVRDDVVILKWLIRYNRTPLERREKELPNIEYQEHIVTTIKGVPVSGIDFDQRRDSRK